MKHRLLILGITVIIVLTLLPTAALAYDSGGETYNEHDYNAMVNFLNQPSAIEGQTNAQALGYNPSDPATWKGVKWTDSGGGELHVQEIDFSGKSLAGSLDVSGCAALWYMDCSKNQLTTLDLNGCAALINLSCDENQLTSLIVGGCPALWYMECNKNQLTTLDVSGCLALGGLVCSYNDLIALNGIGGCAALQALYCNGNQLITLDLSGCAALWYMECNGNKLAILDLSGCPALRFLECSENNLASLDVSANFSLEFLTCSDNELASLDTSINTNMDYLICTGNPMTKLNACLRGSNMSIASVGDGYTGFNYNDSEYYVQAVPIVPAAFYNWMESGSEVSADEKFNLDGGRDYDLTANFLSFSSSAADEKIYIGERITLTPSIGGGTWDFNPANLAQNGNEFRGLKAGKTTITYSLSKEVRAIYNVTIIEPPQTGDTALINVLGGSWLLALGAAALILIRRRQKKRASSESNV